MDLDGAGLHDIVPEQSADRYPAATLNRYQGMGAPSPTPSSTVTAKVLASVADKARGLCSVSTWETGARILCCFAQWPECDSHTQQHLAVGPPPVLSKCSIFERVRAEKSIKGSPRRFNVP